MDRTVKNGLMKNVGDDGLDGLCGRGLCLFPIGENEGRPAAGGVPVEMAWCPPGTSMMGAESGPLSAWAERERNLRVCRREARRPVSRVLAPPCALQRFYGKTLTTSARHLIFAPCNSSERGGDGGKRPGHGGAPSRPGQGAEIFLRSGR